VGKSPEVTMGARLAALMKKESGDNPLVRVKPGVFALRDWDAATVKAGLDGRKGSKKAKVEEVAAAETVDAEAESSLTTDVADADGGVLVEAIAAPAEEELDEAALDDGEALDDEVAAEVAAAEEGAAAVAAAPPREAPITPPRRSPPRPRPALDPAAGPDEAMRAAALG